MVRRMRALLLACCLVLATAALAQKPSPFGAPWDGRSVISVPRGKPPPLEVGAIANPSTVYLQCLQ